MDDVRALVDATLLARLGGNLYVHLSVPAKPVVEDTVYVTTTPDGQATYVEFGHRGRRVLGCRGPPPPKDAIRRYAALVETYPLRAYVFPAGSAKAVLQKTVRDRRQLEQLLLTTCCATRAR